MRKSVLFKLHFPPRLYTLPQSRGGPDEAMGSLRLPLMVIEIHIDIITWRLLVGWPVYPFYYRPTAVLLALLLLNSISYPSACHSLTPSFALSLHWYTKRPRPVLPGWPSRTSEFITETYHFRLFTLFNTVANIQPQSDPKYPSPRILSNIYPHSSPDWLNGH